MAKGKSDKYVYIKNKIYNIKKHIRRIEDDQKKMQIVEHRRLVQQLEIADELLSKEKPPLTKNQEKLKRFKKALEKSVTDALNLNGLSAKEIEIKKKMHPWEIKRQQKKKAIIEKL